MKISVICPDLSDNCLGRAYLLAKILQRKFKVEIIGVTFKNEIWEPIRNLGDMEYKTIPIKRFPLSYLQVFKLLEKIQGDVIYASKPLFTSFGIGEIKKIIDKKPLVLDIDDWQLGFIQQKINERSIKWTIAYLGLSLLQGYKMDSYINTLISERLVNLADEITVSNEFLKRRFGGTLLYHGRDTDLFNPEYYDNENIRKKYNIENNKKIIMFFGTPRPHKGVEDLINAVNRIRNDNIILIIVGLEKDAPYCNFIVKYASQLLKDKFLGFGIQSFDKIPIFLSMADIVVIPQRRNLATIGQIPAKVFDAMAMAKPIVATNVSDLSIILKGCGWIVEPENPTQLFKAIESILNNFNKAKEFGLKARRKCIERYSWNAMENQLFSVFDKYQ